MLKLCCLLTGEDFKMVNCDTPASKRKITLLATCMIVPVLLWFANTELLVSQVLMEPPFVAVMSATVASLIVFLIERAVILSNGSKLIFWFRVLLGFVVALLGSISMDEVTFKSDIDQQVTINKEATVREALRTILDDSKHDLRDLKADVASKRQAWEDWESKASNNAEGRNGVPYGRGQVARMMETIANEKKGDYISTQAHVSEA